MMKNLTPKARNGIISVAAYLVIYFIMATVLGNMSTARHEKANKLVEKNVTFAAGNYEAEYGSPPSKGPNMIFVHLVEQDAVAKGLKITNFETKHIFIQRNKYFGLRGESSVSVAIAGRVGKNPPELSIDDKKVQLHEKIHANGSTDFSGPARESDLRKDFDQNIPLSQRKLNLKRFENSVPFEEIAPDTFVFMAYDYIEKRGVTISIKK